MFSSPNVPQAICPIQCQFSTIVSGGGLKSGEQRHACKGLNQVVSIICWNEGDITDNRKWPHQTDHRVTTHLQGRRSVGWTYKLWPKMFSSIKKTISPKPKSLWSLIRVLV